MKTNHDHVIVGDGLVGTSAIDAIRKIDRTGSVLLVGAEPDEPSLLSKQLWFGKKKLEDVYLHPRCWCADNGVELLLGRAVTRIDSDGFFPQTEVGGGAMGERGGILTESLVSRGWVARGHPMGGDGRGPSGGAQSETEVVAEIASRLETSADWQDENRKGVIYYLAGGKVRGAMMCNVSGKVEAAREFLGSGTAVGPDDLRGAIH